MSSPRSSMVPQPSASQSGPRIVRLNTSDYDCILTWLEDSNNYNSLFGAGKRPKIDGNVATKNKMLEKLANHVNENSQNRLNLTGSMMYYRIRNYKSSYMKAVMFLQQTGAGLSEKDRKKGIQTISQKVNLICPFFERMDILFGDKPNIKPLAISETVKRNETRDIGSVIGAVVESLSENESGEITEEAPEEESLEEEGLEETITIPNVQRSSVPQRRNRRQYSIELEEGLQNRRTTSKRRRVDINAAADIADDGVDMKIAWDKEKLRLMEESADRSRRLDNEQAKEFKLLDLEYAKNLSRFNLEEASRLKIKEMNASAEIEKETMEKDARLKLLISLFANDESEESIDRHMRIFDKYNV